MGSITEGQYTAEFVVSLAPGNRSVENVTIKSGESISAGEVMAKQTSAATVSTAAASGNTGNGTMGTVTPSALAREGVYQLIFVEPDTDAGNFEVFDPRGVAIGKGTVAVAFSAGGLAFTLADGSADYVAGDRILITVTAPTEVWIALPNDGTVEADGIAWGEYDASLAAVAGVAIVRDAEVQDAELTWPGSISTANKNKAKIELRALGIIVR